MLTNIKTKKGRMVFKTGTSFASVSEIPDQIQVNMEVLAGKVNIGVNFMKEVSPAMPEVKEERDEDGEVTIPFKEAQKAVFYNIPNASNHITVDASELPSYKQFLMEASELALNRLQQDCEKGFEFTGEITNI